MMKKKANVPVLTTDLRQTLKGIVQREIEKLPSDLEALTPKERMVVLCKLIPFVFPKVDSVRSDEGEPSNWSM